MYVLSQLAAGFAVAATAIALGVFYSRGWKGRA